MGLFDSKSSTNNYNDNRTELDNSVNEIGIGAAATILDVGTGDGSTLNIEVVDQGAVQGALALADNSIDSLSKSFSAALGETGNISSSAIKAVENSYKSDSESISQSAFMWGSIAVIAFAAMKLFKG